ncbi:MAG: hypothetical protein KatS3mg129_1025 [Leptospiraceae bacterium]|nr:MAG: hypothetical protein KatS3mg129_1025 [Leptospiraceae bacterium]
MIQEKEVKDYVKEILKKFYDILYKKRIDKGKLLLDEEMIFQAIKDPTKGDIKIIVIYDNVFHIFIESKRHANTYFVVMNDLEAGRFTDRRPFDYYLYSSDPKENYNLYLASISDIETIQKSKELENKWQFYSIELGISQPPLQEKEEIPENIDILDWDKKWEIYKKLSDFDPRKKELQKQLYGFTIKYKKYKQPIEEEKFLLIDPFKINEFIGMITRDIYPINLRNVLRRDYKKEHQKLVEYAKSVLESLNEEVQNRKERFQDSEDYKEYLKNIEKEIFRQINLLE